MPPKKNQAPSSRKKSVASSSNKTDAGLKKTVNKTIKSKVKIKNLLANIRRTGDKKEACARSKIPISTLNFWLKEDEEFAEAYQEALSDFYASDRSRLYAICYRNFVKLASGTATVSKRTIKKTYPFGQGEYEIDEDGNPVKSRPSEIEIKEEVKTIQTPQWVYDRILGNSDIYTAIATLMSSGLYSNQVENEIAQQMNSSAMEAQKILQRNIIAEENPVLS